MWCPARLTCVLLAALMLPASLGPATGQGFPPGYPAPSKPPPSNAPDIARPSAAVPSRPPAASAVRPEAFEAGVTEDELRITAEDPPIVVGRIARTAGNASIRPPGEEEWQPAGLNASIIQGTAIWTEEGGRLALEVAQSRLFLDGNSAVQLDELDEDGMRATLAQGSGFLRLQGIGTHDGIVEVATPEATLATVVDGRYLIEAAAQDGSRPGRIAVFEGVAEITPVGAEPIRLGAGEALILAPGAAPQRVAAGGASPLMAWGLAAEPRRPVPVAARGMTGISELALQGDWGSHAEYGDVWYPPVQQGWQPYRDGSWQWREPWGWTWVDAAPWGYAPAHYGRWVQIGPRWAWAPQPVRVVGWQVRPAWSPALVAFFGGVVIGSAARPVGWVPLGPREPFYPWYRASPRYVQRVNYRQVTNVTVVRNVWVERGGRDYRWDDDRRGDAARTRFHDRRLDQFRNHRAAIQVPERVMLSSQPVRNEARRLRFEDARRADLHGGLPLRPAPETRGVTPRSAERLGFSPAQILASEQRDRGTAPPPAVRAALAERRHDDARDRAAAQRDAARDRNDAQRDAARDAAQRDAARDGADAQRGAARDVRREPGRDPSVRAPDSSGRQALRERLVQQQREADPARRPNDAVRPPQDTQRAEALRQQQQQQRQQARPLPGEQRRQPGDEPRQQQQDPVRQQQQQERRQQQQEQARRQQQEPARQQQPQQERRQQQDQVRQQQPPQQQQQENQARRQQQDQARQQQQQQQEQARRQQQDQARQQQQQQQQEQSRRQQQDQARQQQQQQQQHEQARRQQQDQARQQQQQQQEQARRQQHDQARQQQVEQRRQERQR